MYVHVCMYVRMYASVWKLTSLEITILNGRNFVKYIVMPTVLSVPMGREGVSKTKYTVCIFLNE